MRKGVSARFRATLKLTAMAREAAVDLGALAKHFAHRDGDVVVIDGQLHLIDGAAVTANFNGPYSGSRIK
jgi:hypothetical protein